MHRFSTLKLLLTWIGFCLASPAWAAPLKLTPVTDLQFGEIAPLVPGVPGFFQIAPNGATSIANGAQIGVFNPGTFVLLGDDGLAIILSYAVSAPACDATYLPVCVGAPTITNMTDNFPGMIPNTNCPQPKRCLLNVNFGGRFNFNGTEEGRWDTVITITANYQ